MPPPLLELKSISKSFGATAALKNVTMSIAPGEIIGLVGENGAGKSTLIKILSGLHQPDSGEVLWGGSSARFRNPHHAARSGIATIYQELANFERLTVSENILMDEPWPRRVLMAVDWPRLHARAAERLARFDVQVDPRRQMHLLSSAQRQEVAIARALSKNARLLILDEPSASLTEPEVQRLLAQLTRLRSEGVAILYVSHRLDEILQLANRVMVLRDGELVAEYPVGEASVQRMVHDMVGRKIEEQYARKKEHEPGEVVLEAEALSSPPFFHDVSFQLCAGEILGLGGLIGAGRSEVARAIFGLYPQQSGSMKIRGQLFSPANPAEAVRNGVAYIPEERKRQGFALSQPLRESITIALLRTLVRGGLINRGRENVLAESAISKYGIRARSPRQPLGTLSGGNQQKALLARWLELEPEIIILDEPTRGVDVGAKAEIHRLIDSLAARKKGIILISSDLPELISLSDRVLVLHEGRIAGELTGSAISQEKILLCASGVEQNRGR